MIRKTSFLLFLLFALCTCKPEVKQVKKEKGSVLAVDNFTFLTEFEKFVDTSIKDSLFPGAAIAIVKNNQIIYLKGLGVKKINTTDSVNTHTIFRLASVSKGFAAVLTGIMVQKGLLQWDDLVIKYLPDFKLKNPEYTKLLTIRHILEQTTGLPRHTFTNMIESGIPYPVLRDKLKEVPLTDAPGIVHSYQNIAYSIIADILEKVTGKTYETLLKEEIFIPLGMNDASASFNGLVQSENHAEPHLTTKYGFVPVKNTSEYYTVLPAAGVNASISDLANWLLALTGNKPEVISHETLKEIFTPKIITPKRRKYFFMRWLPVKKTYYAMGWRILDYNDDTIAYHGGYVKGYRAEIAVFPAYHIGIAVICNAPGKFVNTAIPTFFDLFFTYKDKIEKPTSKINTEIRIPFIYKKLEDYAKTAAF